jgi:TatD DNase family protein
MSIFSSSAGLAGFASHASPLRNGVKVEAIAYQLCDIGANLCDEMYSGVYNEKQRHECDLQDVLERARSVNVLKTISTTGSISDAKETLKILNRKTSLDKDTCGSETSTFAQAFGLYMTVGIHPTRADAFQQDEIDESTLSSEELAAIGGSTGSHTLDQLTFLIHTANNQAPAETAGSSSTAGRRTVIALGECGLDYARLKFCTKEQQMEGFLKQLRIAAHPLVDLPLFLHNRDTEGEFLRVMTENHELYKKRGGVVHSYDGSKEEMLTLCELGLYIGINGCSLRTEESHELIKVIPSDRLLLETDAPWCGIKKSHPSFQYIKTSIPNEGIKKKEKWEKGYLVKDRNEPCYLHQVAEVVAELRGISVEELAEQCFRNSHRLFFYDE